MCQDTSKQSDHKLEALYQQLTDRSRQHMQHCKYEHLEPVNLHYQQTVDALIAHGADVAARNANVLLWFPEDVLCWL